MVKSVQFREIFWTGSSKDRSEQEHRIFREAELSRALLFRHQQGGLRPISAGEPRPRGYSTLGHLRVDEKGNGPPQKNFPQNCEECHGGNSMFTHIAAVSKPVRSVSIDPIALWKEESGKLDLLRSLMLQTAAHGR